MKPGLSPRLILAVFMGLLLVAPLTLSAFYVTLLNYIGLYAMVALGLVLLTGVGGLTSFGQAAFVGLGAYTTAVLTTATDLPGWIGWAAGSPWLALLMGLVLTAAVAVLIGALTLRLSGHYLPLGTIAWGISLYFLFGTMAILGGHTGLTGIPPIAIFGYELRQGHQVYYLIWAFLLLGVFTVHNLLDSREGRAIRALKGGMVMAEAMGGEHRPLAHGDFRHRGPACLRIGLVIRAHAALRESDAIRPAHRHRVPVHGGGRRCGPCVGCAGGRGGNHHPQAVAAGLVASVVRQERQFRDHCLRPAHGGDPAQGARRPVADHRGGLQACGADSGGASPDRRQRSAAAAARTSAARTGAARSPQCDPQVWRAGGQQQHESRRTLG